MTDRSMPLASLLVVDDTLENLRLLGNMLGEEGYEVRPVSSGRQALQAVEHDPPDLVLLDVNMPGMDGYEVCRQLRDKAALKDVPVIFLTAWTDRAYMVKAFEVGGADYVTKPFLFEEVLARVATHLALRRARLALAERSDRVRRLEQLLRELGHAGHIPA
jgi:two-component system sensor histidine kinase/response regulator